MVFSDKEEFMKIMITAGIVYSKEISDLTIEVYFDLLIEFSIDQLRNAFEKHFKATDDSGTFFPKPADIIRILHGTNNEKALMALSSVRKAIKRHGHSASIKFADKLIANVISECGGWGEFCMADDFKAQALEREFIRRYEMYMKNPPIEYIDKIVGQVEAQNTANGFLKYIPKTIEIGFDYGKDLNCLEFDGKEQEQITNE